MWGPFGWRDFFSGGGGAAFHSWSQAAQCLGPALALYIADRERSCVLVGVLTLLSSKGGGEHDTPQQEESLTLLCGVTDRTGSENFPEGIRTFKSNMEG